MNHAKLFSIVCAICTLLLLPACISNSNDGPADTAGDSTTDSSGDTTQDSTPADTTQDTGPASVTVDTSGLKQDGRSHPWDDGPEIALCGVIGDDLVLTLVSQTGTDCGGPPPAAIITKNPGDGIDVTFRDDPLVEILNATSGTVSGQTITDAAPANDMDPFNTLFVEAVFHQADSDVSIQLQLSIEHRVFHTVNDFNFSAGANVASVQE